MVITLEQIVTSVRKGLDEAKKAVPLAGIAAQAEAVPHTPRGFRTAIESAPGGIGIIAELKKASPSRGQIRGSFPVGMLAMQLAKGGASAISVLTEEEFFDGSLQNLKEASAASELPCLRKDFIVEEYQLYQARLNHADAVLLIASALSMIEFKALYSRARDLGLEVLCEVHDEAEMEMVAEAGVDIIGVNSRDLKTLEMNPRLHVELARLLPTSVLRIAESGLASGAEIRKLKALGYQGFLIGEMLMKADDAGAALAQLLAEARAPAAMA
ncbi:MAG TPA: indole-3-glycerol phosphate synthase TrpC [Terriglobales bacterium]|nr:indole-3-glycerol phosphate synthase TrpC [Terriglobales bacterium]